MKVLSVSGLNKAYKDFCIENVDFTVEQGKIVGFIGINGAGKTTTIKLLLDLISKDKGEIAFFENETESNNSNYKEKIGVVLDGSFFYEEMTMKQMSKIVAESYESWNYESFNKYMRKFELDINKKISTLSKGMKMKFALAMALSHDAKLLIMDEPAGGLDPLVRKQLDDILLEYVKDGEHSVFFSTHITSDLDKIADEVVFIDKGKVIFQKSKKELLREYSKNGEMPTIEEIMISSIMEGKAC